MDEPTKTRKVRKRDRQADYLWLMRSFTEELTKEARSLARYLKNHTVRIKREETSKPK